MAAPCDPVAAIRELGGHVDRLGDGRLELWFDLDAPESGRVQARRLFSGYKDLLRLQLTVPAGEAPRSVRQLLVSGHVAVRGGRYVLTGRR